MIKRLNREAIIPSTVTIRKDIYQAFNDEQTSIHKELQNVPGKFHSLLTHGHQKIKFRFLELLPIESAKIGNLKK